MGHCKNCGEDLYTTPRWCGDCWRMIWKTFGAVLGTLLARLIAEAVQHAVSGG